MRPILLELQAFGPFAGAERVDFETLGRDGPFLIAGETGAGKTSILDAMCFALYGMSSGHHRDNLEAMRCRQSPWGTDTYVRLTLEIEGEIYRFERGLACKRLKLSAFQSLLQKNAAGVFEPLFENCKAAEMSDKARELIGLDYEQFRQVVILPQGQFERFLTSKVEDKEKILSTLFGIRKWSGIAESFFRIAKERKDASDALKQTMDALLQAEGCDSLDALTQKAEACRADLEETERRFVQSDLPGRKQVLEAQRELKRRFEQQHALEKARDQLLAQLQTAQQKEALLQTADRAEALRGELETGARAEKERLRRSRMVLDAETGAHAGAEALKKAEALLCECQAREEENREKEALLLRCRDQRQAYAKLSALRREDLRLGQALEQSRRTLERLQRDCGAKREAGRLAYAALDRAERESAAGRRRYMEDIYGQIAGELTEGAPCPVCGSEQHPRPAARHEAAPNREALRLLEEAVEEKKSAWGAADRAREEAERTASAGSESCHAAERAAAAARQALEAALASRLPGIEDQAALEARIQDLTAETAAFRETLRTRSEQAEQARAALSAAAARLDQARREAESAAETARTAARELAAALKKQGFASPEEAASAMLDARERNRLREELQAFRTRREENARQLAESAAALTGFEEPDAEALRARGLALEEEEARYHRARATLSGESRRLKERLRQITQMDARFTRDRAQLESDLAFARVLRGDSGVGLQRYVLGVLFSSVIGEANRMLEKVHGGRYRLYRSDAKGEGNKRGLELYIHDARAPEDEGRSVATLSGGEKFLVSLALSIGLSATAQRSGIRLGTLFIDEGFGSLDEHSIDDALDVLSGIQRSSGMVGIISHVSLLYDNLASKVEVRKTESGSHIVQSIG